MFTGIIESIGTVLDITKENTNFHFEIESSIKSQLKVDQSVSHNGVCLTVTKISPFSYFVTAIEETLKKTNLSDLRIGDKVNLERSMLINSRLDGHIVQGHVDQVGVCTSIEDKSGSWVYTFNYLNDQGNITVEKGSICVNGVSLTVVNSQEGRFSVAIIPYTYEHTNFKLIKVDSRVNLEFDIIGKYVKSLTKGYLK